MRNMKGALFDFDGTLCNSKEFICTSFSQTLLGFGHPTPTWEQLLKLCHGATLVEAYQRLTSLKNVEPLCVAHRAYQEKHADMVQLFPNVPETLEIMRSRGIRMSVVTNRGGAVEQAIEKTGIAHLFETVRHVDNTIGNRAKPHPQMLLDALTQMDISPSESVMVGDTRDDTDAGKAANVGMIICTSYGFVGSAIQKHYPHHIINSFPEILNLLGE